MENGSLLMMALIAAAFEQHNNENVSLMSKLKNKIGKLARRKTQLTCFE